MGLFDKIRNKFQKNIESAETAAAPEKELLKYKTKGDSSPNHKAKVYFSSYPGDFKRYFDEISKDIFKYQNCVLYYRADYADKYDEAELSAMLRQMQLFVFVISSGFCFRECQARSFEFGFALEHHIPILPIVVEPGIAIEFPEKMNEVHVGYGDIQYVDKTSQDYSEIPYERKLEVFFRKIFLNDALEDRIKDAFEARIFLSYRKKDRILTQELMQRIHQIPWCRNVAIWYDEFLSTGECWEENLLEQIRACSGMVINVTRAILENGNYVLEEYRTAADMGKTVLPIEMEFADPVKLKAMYEGIAEPADGKNPAALSEMLKNLKFEEKEHTPEHDYLIGLAYLTGFEVERDPERGVRILSSSAEHGFPDAAKKMADLYSQGDGVGRSYEMSIEWEKKYVSLLQKEEMNDEQREKIIIALLNLGENLKDIGRTDEAEKIFNQAKSYNDQMSEQWDEEDGAEKYFWIEKALAALYNSRGEIKETYECYCNILEKTKTLFFKNTERWQLNLADIYVHLGRFSWEEGWLDDSLKYLHNALKLSRDLENRTRDKNHLRMIASVYNDLAMVTRLQCKLEEPKAYFLEAIKINDQLYRELELPLDGRKLYLCYLRLGNICNTLGESDQEKLCYRKGMEIARFLKESTGTKEAEGDFATMLSVMGDLALRNKNYSEAESYYRENLSIREKHAQSMNTYDAQRALAIGYDELSEVYEREGDLKKAAEYNLINLNILNALCDKKPSFDSRRMQVRSLEKASVLCYGRGFVEKAEQGLLMAYDLVKSLVAYSESPVAYDNSTRIYMRLGGFYLDRAPEKAVKYFEDAKTDLIKYIQIDPRKEKYDKLGDCYYYLGKLYFEQLADWEKAKDYLYKSANIYEECLQKKTDRSLYVGLLLTCDLLAKMGDKKMEARAAKLVDIVENM